MRASSFFGVQPQRDTHVPYISLLLMTLMRPHLLPMTFAILCITLLMTTSVATAQEQKSSSYAVSWHGATVAGIKLKHGCPNTKKIIPHALVASSTGLADDLHSFSIRLDSFLSSSSSFPLQGRTKITEEERTRHYISNFSKTLIKVSSNIFGNKKSSSVSPPKQAHDLLSWIMDLQSELHTATFSSKTYVVWDGWKLVNIKATKSHTEDISTPYKNYKNAHVLTITRTRIREDGTSISAPSSLGTLWLSNTNTPQLIAMDFESKVGLASIRLVNTRTQKCK